MVFKNKYEWESDFKQRLDNYRESNPDGFPLSIKIGVDTGCFHDEHSPHAYEEIHRILQNNQYECDFIEHESGPEIIVWVAAGITLTTGIINLTTAIINARAKGRKKGDRASGNLRLIIRGFGNKGNLKEEKILEITDGSLVSEEVVEKAIAAALNDAFKNEK